jgi:hypothetical protein
MGFDIVDYIESLSSRLEELRRVERLAFSTYCCQKLFEEFRDELKAEAGCTVVLEFEATLREIWKCVEGREYSSSVIEEAERSCLNVDWETEEYEDENERLQDYGATETLECFLRLFDVHRSGSSISSAESAERIINRLDFEIQMIIGDDDSFVNPVMKKELGLQNEALNFLESQASVKMVRERFWQ